jgi:hypothetical protein
MTRVLFLTLTLTACATGSGDDAADAEPGDTVVDTNNDAEDGDAACVATDLGDDFQWDPQFGDADTWGPFPEGAVVATTFLRLDPGGTQRFGEVIEPVIGDLMAQGGLMGIALGESVSCGVVRTLTVWQDEAAMMGFVMGEAHANAVRFIGEISRGGSITDHWPIEELTDASWDAVAAKLADHSGPVY